jgi:signal transduction histidine kinase
VAQDGSALAGGGRVTPGVTVADLRLTRGMTAIIWFAAVAAGGLLLFGYRYLGVLAAGEHEPFLVKFIEEMTAGVTVGVLFFPCRALVRGWPLHRDTWRRHAPWYVLAVLLFGAAATSSMWALRSLLFPVAGLGDYHYGMMPMRYFMEFPIQTIIFVCIVGGVHAVDALRAAHLRHIRSAQLESHLAHAQLRNLRLQLQPHFLFNTLNTISSTMYQNPAAADEMIQQLSDLLRASLHTAQRDEVPLAVELDVLDRYLAIMRARFGSRLLITTTIDERAREALVPSMILQPLVENAIRHGNATVTGTGQVEVRASRNGDSLVLEVEDDGPGLPDGVEPRTGVGLTATSERLTLLYGDAHRFEAGRGAAGGFLVRAAFPFRTGTAPAALPPEAAEATAP